MESGAPTWLVALASGCHPLARTASVVCEVKQAIGVKSWTRLTLGFNVRIRWWLSRKCFFE